VYFSIEIVDCNRIFEKVITTLLPTRKVKGLVYRGDVMLSDRGSWTKWHTALIYFVKAADLASNYETGECIYWLCFTWCFNYFNYIHWYVTISAWKHFSISESELY